MTGRDVSNAKRDGLFEHCVSDMIESKSQVGSGFVLSIRDRDADTSFDVDIGFERRRQANGAR